MNATTVAPAVRPDIPTRHRVRTPTVIQMEAVECGAASLGIVLAHHGRFIPLEELRRDCGVSRDGSSAGSLLKAARGYGMIGKGLQLDLTDLPTLPLPAILFWRFNHFLVLEGYSRRGVRLNDPATGPRRVPWQEFDHSFTGIAVTLAPGPDFRRGGHRHTLLAALLERRPKLGSALYLAVLLGAVIAAAGLTMPVLTRLFVDRVLLGDGNGGLAGLIVVMAIATLLTIVASIAQQRLLLRGEAVFALGSATRLVRHMLRLPVVFFDQRQPADLANRVRSNDVVADVLVRRVATTVVDCVLVGTYGALLAHYDRVLGLLAVIFAGLNFVALRSISAMRKNAVSGLQVERGQLTTTVFTSVQMVESIKASGEEQTAFQRFASRAAAVTSSEQRLGVPTAVLSVVPALLATLNTALLLWIGNYRIVEGSLTVGTLVGMQGLIMAMNRPVTNLTMLGSRLQESSADLQRLRDVQRYPVLSVTGPPAELEILSGHLRIDNLTFGYNPLAKPLLQNFSLEILPGSRIALVGSSGSGKSTIGRLVAGLYEPWEGSITIDGKRRQEIDPDVWAATLAMVDQESLSFEASVRDNITLWDASIGDDQVISALSDAAIYDEIASRPGGLASPVAEGGRNFSGGQRQRLEIARALVRRPRVLVLDEATSALDAETEQVIDRNLRRTGATCLIVAHRLSTIRDCDQIIVLGPGGEIERGTHPELLRSAGAYAALVRDR